MFSGYHFFDYKYSIPGYTGQDYDGYPRIIYLVASIVLIFLLLVLFRKAKRETVHRYLKVLGIFMIALYIIKTTWESYFDITISDGFNLGILPFDTCSIIMWAGVLAGWGKGKIKTASECWLASGGVVGGIANLLFLRALLYYPFFTFGAFYSMIWHFLMVFTGLWLLVTNYAESSFKTILYGFIFHMIISIPVIIFDYTWLQGQDFMLYTQASGIPLVSDWAATMISEGRAGFVPFMVAACYFLSFALIVYASWGLKGLLHLIWKKTPAEDKIA